MNTYPGRSKVILKDRKRVKRVWFFLQQVQGEECAQFNRTYWLFSIYTGNLLPPPPHPPRLSVVSRHFKTTGLSWSNCELARVHVQLWANLWKSGRTYVVFQIYFLSRQLLRKNSRFSVTRTRSWGEDTTKSFFVRMCGPNLETCTTFQTNIWEFSYYFLDQSQKSTSHLRFLKLAHSSYMWAQLTGIGFHLYEHLRGVQIYRRRCGKNGRFLPGKQNTQCQARGKSMLFFIPKWWNSMRFFRPGKQNTQSCPSQREKHTLFQTKTVKIDALFQTKIAKKKTFTTWVPHIPKSGSITRAPVTLWTRRK